MRTRVPRRIVSGGAFLGMALGACAPLVALSPDLGWGPTHAAWEQAAIRSTIQLDGLSVTATRSSEGAVAARLAGSDGAAVAELDLSLGLDGTMRLKTRGVSKELAAVEIPYTGAAAPVLDWLNLELISLWRGRGGSRSEESEADTTNGVRQRRTGRDLASGEAAAGVLAAELEYAREVARSARLDTGFVTYLWAKRAADQWTGPEGAGARPKLLAILVWEQDRQILSMSFGEAAPEAREFYALRAEDLPLGFFPFQPTMSWANVQIRQTWLEQEERHESLFLKNTVGCDGLHWLDKSSLRPCCDDHDRCYRARAMFTGAACESLSWFWPFCGSNPSCTWQCQACNVTVVGCFAVNLTRRPFHPDYPEYGIWWSWGYPPPICHLDFPGYCPPECAWCT